MQCCPTTESTMASFPSQFLVQTVSIQVMENPMEFPTEERIIFHVNSFLIIGKSTVTLALRFDVVSVVCLLQVNYHLL